ncbi:MAG TPA: zf-TFIIB domain-containing protein [Pyrinomonadaceae bacterium]|nr:zf-TFIIB domain-containing protein [Pyrinomonadaceae bacterium]
MSDIFDERRRGLEEEYFRRRDKESLERLREAIREDARTRDLGPVTMPCPRCTGKLHEDSYDEVSINRCDTCGGIWLDAGELEHIISQESSASRWLHAFWPGRTNE